jgi:DNA-binding NarL/FixJ family response regulator
MTSQTSIQVLVLASDDDNRQALRDFFLSKPALTLKAEATNASEALQHLNTKQVDVALLELGAADADSIELTKQIRKSHPTVRVLISTASNTPEDIFAVMNAGADGYVLRGNDIGLEKAISTVRLGAVWLDPGIAAQVLEALVSAPPSTRVLQTGMMTLPLMPDEKQLLNDLAGSNCTDGVCMVDPSFVRNLRRFAPGQSF